MPNSFRIKPRHVIVLDLLGQGKTQEEIAQITGKNPSSVSRMVKRLEDNGLVRSPVRTSRKIFNLENYGYNVVKAVREQSGGKNATFKSATSHQVSEKSNFGHEPLMEYRLHALLLEFPLISPIDIEKSMRTFKFEDHPTLFKDISNVRVRELNNHKDLLFDYRDFTVTLTTQTMLITGLQIILPYKSAHSVQELFNKVIETISPEISSLESKFKIAFENFHLKKGMEGLKSSFVMETAKLEIALTNDGLAQKVGVIQKETGQKLHVYNDQGELDWIVDFSMGPGIPEIESVNKDPGRAIQNMEIYHKFLKGLTRGDFSPEKMNEAIGALYETTMQIAESNRLLQEQNVILQKQLDRKDAEIAEMKELMGEFINKFGDTALTNQQQIGQLTRTIGGLSL